MLHYYIELAIWLVLAYLIGCLFGWFLKNLGRGPAPAATLAAPVAVAKMAMPVTATAVSTAPVVKAPVAPVVMAPVAPIVRAPVAPVVMAPAAPVVSSPTTPATHRPKGIAAARGGKADDLQRISGIGPKNEKILHSLGTFHFDQISQWTAKEQTWVDDHLKFHGRIVREEWVRQATLLAAGKEAEFNKEFGTGGMKAKDGETQSGTHTRKR